MKNLVWCFIVFLSVLSCKKQEPDVVIEYLYHYAMVNESGVKIAIVPKGDRAYIPDSLVLENGETYMWSLHPNATWIISSDPLTPVKVYFNETVVISYTGFPELTPPAFRDPRFWQSYNYKLLNDDIEAHVYTFTVKDYQQAVEQNKPEK